MKQAAEQCGQRSGWIGQEEALEAELAYVWRNGAGHRTVWSAEWMDWIKGGLEAEPGTGRAAEWLSSAESVLLVTKQWARLGRMHLLSYLSHILISKRNPNRKECQSGLGKKLLR